MQQTYQQQAETTGWVGWIVFAGVMMIIGGILSTIFGIVAAVNDEWVVFQSGDAVYLDVSQWGWAHIIVGLVVFLCGFGVFTGNLLARSVAVIIAALSLIAHFFWLPLFPIWALIVITIDVLVIWALTVHGGEMRAWSSQ
jgi:hypothetical protein